eukprot:220087-Chlamydomonas_euryale.AAC.1
MLSPPPASPPEPTTHRFVCVVRDDDAAGRADGDAARHSQLLHLRGLDAVRAWRGCGGVEV